MPQDCTLASLRPTKERSGSTLGRVARYAHSHRLTMVEAVSEVGAGRNGHRPKLIRLLADPKVGALVVNTVTGEWVSAPSMLRPRLPH